MSIGAMEHHDDDELCTSHHNKSQDFDDLEDNEAHDGGPSKQDHGSPHQDESIDDKQQYQDECFSSSDQPRCAH